VYLSHLQGFDVYISLCEAFHVSLSLSIISLICRVLLCNDRYTYFLICKGFHVCLSSCICLICMVLSYNEKYTCVFLSRGVFLICRVLLMGVCLICRVLLKCVCVLHPQRHFGEAIPISQIITNGSLL